MNVIGETLVIVKKFMTVAVISTSLLGCAAVMPEKGDDSKPVDSVEDALQEAAAPAPAAAPVPKATQQDARLLPRTPYPHEDRFNVNSSNTAASEFFMGLVDGTEHNIVVHPDVSGQISLTLKNVTVDEVLDVVSDVYGYAYRKSGAGYVVLPASVQSRIFQVDYLNLKRSGTSRTRVSSGQVSEGARRGGSGGRGSQMGGLQDAYGGD
jgi:MSHA biogenesis protein MshL